MAGSRLQRELALLVTGRDVSATRTLRGVSREMQKAERIAGKAGTNMGRNLERGVVLGAGAAVGAIGYAINAAQDWESAVAGVAKTVDGDVSTIAAGIRDMSREVPLAATELAGLAESAGALGIAKEDILDFTRVSATLGVTTNVSADDAATALGQLGNVLDLHSADFERFGSTLVDLGNKGASTEAQILEITRRAGGAAHLLGLGAAATLGWSSAMANLGINEELAGTALQSFFTKSLGIVSTGGADLAKMAKIAGQTGKAFKKAFAKDAGAALETFIAGLAKLPKDQRLKAVQDLFGKTSGLNRGLLGLADSYSRNLAPSIDTATSAWEANTAMGAEAEKRYKTTASQVQLLKNNFHDAAITVGTELLPVVNDLAKEGVDWLKGHQPEIAQFAKDLAAGLKDAVKWASSLDWEAIGNALKTGAGFAKDLINAFASAPPWIQQLLVGGFVANKFTGGAISDVIGDVMGAALKQKLGLMTVQAGVVNVNGGVAGGAAGGAAVTAAGIVKGLAGLGIGFVGSQVLSGGIQQGGPAGAAQGALGGAAMIGGGALAFGPLGAIAGSLAAVVQTQQTVAAQNSQLGSQISQGISSQISGGATLAELQTSLAAVDTGINEIQANPLNVLVQGSALDELRSSRTQLVAAIAAQSNTALRGVVASERQEAIAAQASAKEAADAAALLGATHGLDATARSQLGGVISQVQASKSATVSATSAVAVAARAAGQTSAAAIRDKDLSVTFSPKIVTTVSVKETINTTTTYKKYQKVQT